MRKSQRTYSEEFKRQAVQLLETSGKSKIQIARDLGISNSYLSKWSKEFGKRGKEALPGKDHQKLREDENKELRCEIDLLRQERDTLKKTCEDLRVPPSVKFQFLHDHRHLFPLLRMCQVLSVSENGYYNWRTRGKSQRKKDDERLVARIEDAYYKSGGTYGSPRIHLELRAQGIRCGRKRVARLMREKQLIAIRSNEEGKNP